MQSLALQFLIAKYKPSVARGMTVFTRRIPIVDSDDLNVFGKFLNTIFPNMGHLILGGVYITSSRLTSLVSVSSFDPKFPDSYIAGALYVMKKKPGNKGITYVFGKATKGFVYSITTEDPVPKNQVKLESGEIYNIVPGRHFRVNNQIKLKLHENDNKILLANANDSTLGILKIKRKGNDFTPKITSIKAWKFLLTETESKEPIADIFELELEDGIGELGDLENLDIEGFEDVPVIISTKSAHTELLGYTSIDAKEFKGFYVLPKEERVFRDILNKSDITDTTTTMYVSRSNFFNVPQKPVPGLYIFDVHIPPVMPKQRRPGTTKSIKDVQTSYKTNSYTPFLKLHINPEIAKVFKYSNFAIHLDDAIKNIADNITDPKERANVLALFDKYHNKNRIIYTE